MKDNKLKQSASNYHSSRSAQLAVHRQSQLSRINSYQSRKQPIFSREMSYHSHVSSPMSYLNRESFGIFSLQKLNIDKIKQQKEFLEKAKTPSFNIKKILEHTAKKRKESSHQKDRSERYDSQNKYDLKSFWNSFMQSQMLTPNFSSQIENFNKKMGLVVNMSKEHKSQSKGSKRENVPIKRTSPELNALQLPLRVQAHDRTTFYVNNFIKTRYRKRQISTYHQAQRKTPKNKKYRGEQFFENSEVVPWEKVHDTEQDTFIGQ